MTQVILFLYFLFYQVIKLIAARQHKILLYIFSVNLFNALDYF